MILRWLAALLLVDLLLAAVAAFVMVVFGWRIDPLMAVPALLIMAGLYLVRRGDEP